VTLLKQIFLFEYSGFFSISQHFFYDAKKVTLFFHLPDKFLRYSEGIKFKGGYIHEEENMDEIHCRLSYIGTFRYDGAGAGGG
jgi:hypothetical protein